MRSSSRLPAALHATILLTMVAGAVVCWLAGGFVWLPEQVPVLVLLVALSALCNLDPRTEWGIRNARLTLGVAIVCLAQITLGVRAALVVAGVGALIDATLNPVGKEERQLGDAPLLYGAVFHCGVTWLATWFAGVAYMAVLARSPTSGPASMYLATTIWAAVYLVTGTLVEGIARAAARDRSVQTEWLLSIARTWPNCLAAAFLAPTIFVAHQAAGTRVAVVGLVVVYLIHFAFRFYIERGAATRQFESVLAGTRDGIILLDGYRIVYTNEAFAQLLGRTRTDVIGREYPEFLPQHSMGWTDLGALAEAGIAEIEMRRANGSLVRVEVSVSPVIYQSQPGLQLVARDVTARYALQRQAAQTQRLQALGQMAAGVAHDFNNALMAIIGNVSVARTLVGRPGAENLAKATSRLTIAEQAAMDAAATVRRLQVYSRPAPDTVEAVDLHELAREVRLILRPLWSDACTAEGRQIRVSVGGDASVPVLASAAELREAITNLVTNAVHALPQGGAIRLEARRHDGEAMLTVVDDGIGMSPETVDHVFEPFFTTKGSAGTGLGLFVTAGIVKHHGGRIEVESSPGEGTTFRLYFPLSQADGSQVEEPVPELPAGLRVLIVDDDPLVCEATSAMLETVGLHVEVCSSGIAAIEAMASRSHDLVITDFTMPGMGGQELARQIRARWADVPIILVSGWLEGALSEEPTDDSLFAATLGKPLTMRALLEAVHDAIVPPENAAEVGGLGTGPPRNAATL